ncbi:MAG: DUF2924 domain-containing protein [Phycisphaerales bacterium JB037]
MNTPRIEPDSLPGLTLPRLHALWHELRLPGRPPTLKRILLREIAWRMQARETGGLDSETRRLLARATRSAASDSRARPQKRRSATRLQPGSTLIRTWRGREHRVAVTSTGFRYDDRDYASLSEIAREITGARWSGPRFFGLDRVREAS